MTDRTALAEEIDTSAAGYEEKPGRENTAGKRPTAAHTQTKKSGKRRKKKRKFPLGGLILLVLLVACILASAYYGKRFYDQNRELTERYQDALKSAEAELEEAKRLLPEDEEYNKMIEECEAAQQENKQLEEEILSAEQEIDKLKQAEDFDYFRSIYDEYTEGRTYVEKLLAGD